MLKGQFFACQFLSIAAQTFTFFGVVLTCQILKILKLPYSVLHCCFFLSVGLAPHVMWRGLSVCWDTS